MKGKKKCIKLYKVNGRLVNDVIREKGIMDKVSNECCITPRHIRELDKYSNYLLLPDLLKMIDLINDSRITFENIVVTDRLALYPVKRYMVNGQHFEYWRECMLHNTQAFLSFKSGYSYNLISFIENNKRSMSLYELQDWIKLSNLPENFLTDIGPVQIVDEKGYTPKRYTKKIMEEEKLINSISSKLYRLSYDDLKNIDKQIDTILRRSKDDVTKD